MIYGLVGRYYTAEMLYCSCYLINYLKSCSCLIIRDVNLKRDITGKLGIFVFVFLLFVNNITLKQCIEDKTFVKKQNDGNNSQFNNTKNNILMAYSIKRLTT